MTENKTTTAKTVKPRQPWEDLVEGVVDAMMTDALSNLAENPSSEYDKGYHDALLDVLDGLGLRAKPNYGERFD